MLLATNPHICFSLMEAKNQNKQSSKWTPRVGINESYFLARTHFFVCYKKSGNNSLHCKFEKYFIWEPVIKETVLCLMYQSHHTLETNIVLILFKKSWSISLSRKSIISISLNKKVTNASKESLLYSCNWDRAHFTKETAERQISLNCVLPEYSSPYLGLA